MYLLDGKKTAQTMRSKLRQNITNLSAINRKPCLAVILVGDDPASQVYVRNKERACEEAGIISEAFKLPALTTQEDLLCLIDALNQRPDVDGILLQLPLPSHLDSYACLEKIAPHKDVDGFHPVNMGRLALGLPGLRPCTPAGIMALLKAYDISPAGKHAVIVGRSNIVGKPLALMLGAPGQFADATVTVCHSKTPDLASVCRSADLLVAAIGKPRLITGDMVKPGAVVIDVGINRTPDGLSGDCNFLEISQIATAITPVPGGIGPMTIAMLLENTVSAYRQHIQTGISQ